MARAPWRRYAAQRLSRTWRVAAVVAVSALAAAGCSSSSSSSSSSTTAAAGSSSTALPAGGSSTAPGNATSGTINWWASPINTSGTDVRQVLIKDFEAQYPNIKVSLTSAPTNTDTNRATLATDISGGATTPDVFMGDVIWPAQFGAHQLAVPLSDYLPSSYWAQFAPGLVQGATYNGKVYGSPLFEDQGFLYYRKDLLAKEHLPVPTTWEQLESESETLQKAGLVKYGFVWEGASYEGLTCNYMEYLADAGGTATNSSYTTASLDSAAAVKATTFMRSLITSGVSPAAVTTFQEAQAMSTFASGQAAFLRNWDYAYADSQVPGTPTVGKVGVAPLPTFQGESYPGYSNIGG
jgi:multiple sugar transport system substrate-binding protein